MDISKKDFFQFSEKFAIPKNQSEQLWQALEEVGEKSPNSGFELSHVVYYFGAFIILTAMSWFFGISWAMLGGAGIFLIAVAYGLLFFVIGKRLWSKPDLKTPGGLLITLAVCMVPLAIYGLELYLKIWPDDISTDHLPDFLTRVKVSWIWMDLGTIVAGLLALRYFSFPFLTAPIFCAAWMLLMDLGPIMFGPDASWKVLDRLSLGFGGLLMGLGYWIDLKHKAHWQSKDFAFWSYFFGAIAFWFAMTSLMWDKSEAVLVVYFLINILLVMLSVLLQRRILLILGVIGCFGYLAHLTYSLFEDTLLFPFILTLIGLGTIYLGILYQRHAEQIQAWFFKAIPTTFRKYIP